MVEVVGRVHAWEPTRIVSELPVRVMRCSSCDRYCSEFSEPLDACPGRQPETSPHD